MLSNMLQNTMTFAMDFENFKRDNIEYEKTQPQKLVESKRSQRSEHTNQNPHANTHRNQNPHADTHNNRNNHSNYSSGGPSHTNRNNHSDYYSHTNNHTDRNSHTNQNIRNTGYKHIQGHARTHANGSSYPKGTHTNYWVDFGRHDEMAHYDTVSHNNSNPHSNSGSNYDRHTNSGGHSNYNTDYYNHTNSPYHTNTGGSGYQHTNTGSSGYSHTNTSNHIDYGFNHLNHIPSVPALFNVSQSKRIRGVVKIGLSSYDKDGDTIKYTLKIRRKGATSWTTLLNETTVESFNLDTTKYADGEYEIAASAKNDPMSQRGMTKTYVSDEKKITVEIKQNIDSTVQVQNASEILNFTFGEDGALIPNEFKSYASGLYTTNPANQKDGILLRISMRDEDIDQYQKGKVQLLDNSGGVILTEDVIWSNGSKVIQSGNTNRTGYIFVSKDNAALKGKEITRAKFKVTIYEYADAACRDLVADTTVLDTVSITDTRKLEFRLDFDKPNVKVNYTSGVANYVKRANANIEVTDNSGIRKVEYQWVEQGKDAVENKWITGTSIMSTTSPEGLTGNYILHVRATDKVGNVHHKKDSGIVKLDNEGPTINFEYEERTVGKQNHRVKVRITDNKSGPKNTFLYQWTNNSTAPTGGTWKQGTNGEFIDTDGSIDGQSGIYYLHIKAEDTLGNASVSSSSGVTMDNTAATITFTPNGNTKYERKQTTKVFAEDASGIDNVKYKWSTSGVFTEGGEWTNLVSGEEIVQPNGTGDYYLHILSKDRAGNIGKDTSKVFKLDNTSPTAVITGNPTTWTNPDVSLRITIEDAHSGVGSIKTPDGTWVEGATTTYTVSENGTYEFEFKDLAGNLNTTSVTVSKINNLVGIESIKLENGGSTIDYNGKPTLVIPRNEFYAVIVTDIVDKDIDDDLHYTLEVNGTKYVNRRKLTRDSEKVKVKDSIWLIDENTNNWPDGVYNIKVTVTDSKDGAPNLSSATKETNMLVLREKPPVPRININTVSKTATIDYPPHPILVGELESSLKKEYAIGNGSYKDYNGEIDMSTYTNGTTIYAKYTDFNGNYTISVINYIPGEEQDSGNEIIPGSSGKATVEDTRTGENIFINIRKPSDDRGIKDGTFDFLDD